MEGRLEVAGVASMGVSCIWEQLDLRLSACALSCVDVRQLPFRYICMAEDHCAKPLYPAESL